MASGGGSFVATSSGTSLPPGAMGGASGHHLVWTGPTSGASSDLGAFRRYEYPPELSLSKAEVRALLLLDTVWMFARDRIGRYNASQAIVDGNGRYLLGFAPRTINRLIEKGWAQVEDQDENGNPMTVVRSARPGVLR